LEGRPENYGDHGPDALRYGVWNYIRGPGKPVDVATGISDEEVKARLQDRMNRVVEVYRRHMQEAAERMS
jgi:hypothetical protein